ncbi:type 2 lanthipeptide synthetase LanM [Sanguibacter sp. 25GB23B1]|uniref:type 2 lanthipeptide synthetase LanM n=1 Tax=unclassified Sanguibacter TaxID=2645534 RepID=UPI0032AFD424
MTNILTDLDEPAPGAPESSFGHPGVFEGFYEPFVVDFQDRLARRLADRPRQVVDGHAFAHAAAEDLFEQLVHLASRTLVHEFRAVVGTESRYDVEGVPVDQIPLYDPDLPTGRYRAFHEQVSSPGGREAVLSTYPVLRRLLEQSVAARLRLLGEMLDHADEDLVPGASSFSSPGRVVRARCSAGDSHNGGRQVLVVTFEDATLVYKPKGLGTDRLLAEIAALVTAHVPAPLALRPSPTLTRDDHGWQAFVEHTACADEAGLEAYYQRMGLYLAVFFVLGTGDLHFENIIADGSQPQFIDLETLFAHPRRVAPTDGDLRQAFVDELSESVLNTMMLPLRFHGSPQDFNMAGLGMTGKQASGYWKSYTIGARGSDELRFAKYATELEHTLNMPLLDGHHHPAVDFSDAVQEGFDLGTAVLAAHRAELVALLRAEQHVGMRVRQVLRPTATYARFLEASTHPVYLTDEATRRTLLAKLRACPAVRTERGEQVLALEIDALADGDIPYFTTTLGSRDLLGNRVDEVADVYEVTLQQHVEESVSARLARDHLLDQHYIHTALLTSIDNPWAAPSARPSQFSKELFDRTDPVGFAEGLVERLDRLSVWDGARERCTWIGALLDADDRSVLGPSDLSLYGGGGTMLFLTAMVRRDGHPQARRLLDAGTLDAAWWAGGDEKGGSASAYSGSAGSALVVNEILAALPGGRCTAIRDTLLDTLRGVHLTALEEVDLVGGAAGIAVVLAGAMRAGVADFSEELDGLGRRLAGALADGGLPPELAHGSVGVAYGLAQCGAVLEDDDLRSAAEAALLEVARGTGYVDAMEPRQRTTWCRGVPGVAAGLALGLDALGYPADAIAARTTAHTDVVVDLSRRRRSAPDISLCHGAGGEVASLAGIGRLTGDDALVEQARHVWDDLCEAAATHGYSGGLRRSAGQTGFMGGLGGLAYAGLMLEDPSLSMPGSLRWTPAAAPASPDGRLQ